VSKKAKARRFVYVPDKPDVSQARESAYEWHGRRWSPLLYCYASLECKIANEDFRKAVLKEIEVAMRDVEANPALYAEEEPAKLQNLKKCVETANTNTTGNPSTILRAERRSKLNTGLIFKGWDKQNT
jgi:hypothetical protein